jgi:integrase
MFAAALQAAGSRFSARGYAAGLRPKSIKKAAEGYGRWLGYLSFHGQLDQTEMPSARLTPERLDAYVAFLKELRNANATILGRFTELWMALRIMDPAWDPRQLTGSNGKGLRAYLQVRPRRITVYDPALLHEWGIELMQQALTDENHRTRRTGLRTGLMIALQSLQALRLGSLAQLELGSSLVQEEGQWWIRLDPSQVKNKRALDAPWPEHLVPWLERYLAVERAELLGGGTTQHLWVNRNGESLGEAGITFCIRAASAERFGEAEAFGTHRFRHCLGTAIPLLMPEHAAIAAAILNVGGQVVASNYTRGSNVLAARTYHAAVETKRDATKDLAREAFARRHRGILTTWNRA